MKFALATFMTLSCVTSMAIAGESKGDSSIAKQKAVSIDGRAAAGAMIGGQAGKIVGGSPAGAAVGITLSPSKIGCDPKYEACANK